MDEDLDAQIRRIDPDRWLSSRFVADEAARADLIALYALDQELTRIPFAVSDSLMGEIRLTWWREAMDEIALGRPPRRHPVVLALAGSAFPAQMLADLIEGRYADLEAEPFADRASVLAYLDATAGAVVGLAAGRLDANAGPDAVVSAARAFGLARLWRLKQTGHRGRLPLDWTEHDIRREIHMALKASRAELAGLPVAAFPAVAHGSLAGRYARNKNPGDLEKRARILLAVLTGRI